MDISKRIVEWSREKRTIWLKPIGIIFAKLKIKAIYLTFLSFIFGLAAVYFLFENSFYFILFGLLHLIMDSLDGLAARATKTSQLGAHLDNISDRAVIVLILIKSYFYFNDYFILIVLAIHLTHHLIFIFSNLKGKVCYSRTITLVAYFFGFYAAGYFIVAALSLYGLSLQFKAFLKKKFKT